MKIIILFGVCFGIFTCFGSSKEPDLTIIEKELRGENTHKRLLEISHQLIKIIEMPDSDDHIAKNDDPKILAANLIGKYKLVNCIDILIKEIDTLGPFYSTMKIETTQPCVGALINIGRPAVAKLTEAIEKESNEFRMRLMSYSLMKIMTKKKALEHLDTLISSNISEAKRIRYREAKVGVNRWSGSLSKKNKKNRE